MFLSVAASSILDGLLLLLVIVVVSSRIFEGVATTNGGADCNGFEEYLDSSGSAAIRED
jgi:hypothetical protein